MQLKERLGVLLLYCGTTRFPSTHPMQSIEEGWGFYCGTTRFPGTHPMQSIEEGWGSY